MDSEIFINCYELLKWNKKHIQRKLSKFTFCCLTFSHLRDVKTNVQHFELDFNYFNAVHNVHNWLRVLLRDEIAQCACKPIAHNVVVRCRERICKSKHQPNTEG